MSQYRDDRGAARLRIETLEARLAEQEAELCRSRQEIAVRDEEIVRLQRGITRPGGAGARELRAVDAAWASRVVAAAAGLALVAAGAGGILARSSASAVPPTVVLVEAPLHADPVVATGFDWSSAQGAAEEPAAPAAGTLEGGGGKAEVVRQVEPRVWGGRPKVDDVRLRRAICDAPACRERARDALERARERER